MNKHTPGPWTYAYDVQGLLTIDSKEKHVATSANPWRTHDIEREANARLIAAAPDLLAALKLARFAMSSATQRGFSGGNPTLPHEWHAINEAIAKAEQG